MAEKIGKKKKTDEELHEAWLVEVRESLKDSPEALSAFETLVDHPQGKTIRLGGYRQDDYYRRLNELNEQKLAQEAELETWKQQLSADETALKQWWETNLPVAEGLKSQNLELQKALDDARAALKLYDPSVEEKDTKESLEMADQAVLKALQDEIKALKGQVQAVDYGIPAVFGGLLNCTTDAIKQGYDISPKDLMEMCMQKSITPEMAYEELTRDSRREKEEKAVQKRIDDAVALALAEQAKQRFATPDQNVRAASLPYVFGKVAEVAGNTGREERMQHALSLFMEDEK